MMVRVDVVMATYNGAAYLDEMLQSLEAQQWSDLRLIACDDGSTDDTVRILEDFRARSGMTVSIVRNQVNLGARDNFSQALSLADADYIALADQDDIWLPGKIGDMVAAMQRIEAGADGNIPALVHSDLKIVDGHLNVLAESYFNGTFKSRSARSVADFCISNHVPGCAIMVNKALLRLALPIPAQIYMHDWWLCLVGAAGGVVGHVERPLVLFRRHGGNATASGSQKHRAGWIGRALKRARTPFRYAHERWEGTSRLAGDANERLALVTERLGGAIGGDARRLIGQLASRRWRDRYSALRTANSGDSPATELLVAINMGRAVNRTMLGESSAASRR